LFENAEISIWNEDISAMRQALAGLRQDGVSDLRKYLDDDEQAVWELAALVEVRQVNEATLELFGAESETVMLGQIESTSGSGAIGVFKDVLLAHWNGETVFRSEANFKKLDGTEFPAIMTFRIPESDDEFHSVPVSIIDITDRRRAEEELRRYEVIVASSSDVIALVDKNFTYLAANPAYLRLVGRTTGEVIGYNMSEVLGEKLFTEVVKPNGERLFAGGEVHFQDWIKFPGFEQIRMDVRYSPYLSDTGEIRGFAVIGRDISDHIEAAVKLDAATGRLSAIVEQAGEAIITIDAAQKIQVFNHAAEDLFGFAEAEAKAMNLDDLIPDLLRDAHRKHAAVFWAPARTND